MSAAAERPLLYERFPVLRESMPHLDLSSGNATPVRRLELRERRITPQPDF